VKCWTPRQVVLSIVVLGASVVGVSGQTADELFDPHVIQDVSLVMNSGDLQQLREQSQSNAYYAADLTWKGLRVRNVGVRSRGVSSRSDVKLALRVDFNFYATGQRFLGLTALVLDNHWTDPSMIRERVAMAMFARMGQPAPRLSFARLSINGVYQGLYSLVEPVDSNYLSRTLGERDGYLFEYRWHRPYFGEYLGEDLGPYRELFEPETHRSASETILYAPIHDLLREVNEAPDSVWRESVDRYLDLEQLVTYVAIETFLSERDGFAGHAGMANFFVYRSANSTRHRLLTWDRDNAFERIEFPIFERTEQSVILRRAFELPDLRTRYLETLERCALSAAEADWLESEVAESAGLITALALEDERKQFSNDEFAAAVDHLREFGRRRSAFVLREVARARQESTRR
jgi:spore coat protein CotH